MVLMGPVICQEPPVIWPWMEALVRVVLSLAAPRRRRLAEKFSAMLRVVRAGAEMEPVSQRWAVRVVMGLVAVRKELVTLASVSVLSVVAVRVA